MDPRLDQNQPELRVLVLAIAFQVLSYVHRLLDQEVEIFGDFGRQSFRLENAQNLVACHPTDLSDAATVTQNNADL